MDPRLCCFGASNVNDVSLVCPESVLPTHSLAATHKIAQFDNSAPSALVRQRIPEGETSTCSGPRGPKAINNSPVWVFFVSSGRDA